MSEPQDTPPRTEEPDDEVEPAFDIDLAPEDQGTAEAAAEQSG